MKVKVLKTFRDKETGSVLRPGLIVDFSEERVEVLASTPDPFVDAIEDEKPKENEVIEVEEGKFVLPNVEKMKKEDIIKFAKDVMEIELNTDMTKAEMIKLLKK